MSSRRKLIKSALSIGAVGSVVSSSWVKPVMNSVMLPAHAQTSMLSTKFASISALIGHNQKIEDGSMLTKAFSILIPEAHAVSAVSTEFTLVVITSADQSTYDATLLIESTLSHVKAFYTVAGAVGGGSVTASDPGGCGGELTFEVSSVSDAGADYSISVSDSGFHLTLTGNGTLPADTSATPPVNPMIGENCPIDLV